MQVFFPYLKCKAVAFILQYYSMRLVLLLLLVYVILLLFQYVVRLVVASTI